MNPKTLSACLRRYLAFAFASAVMSPFVATAARSSASYSIPADSIDSSGAFMQSASYSFAGSAAGEFAVGSNPIATSAAYRAKHGYIGALYDIIALSVTAPPSASLNEGTTRQLVAAPLADDDTNATPLVASTVAWSIVSGPITSISSAGLATAATVYQDTSATIQGNAQGLTGQLALTVLNVNTDDFGAYASDGIDDVWQVQYFGQPPNALASPVMDPDGDGQSNLFEYIAGGAPTDPNSRFVYVIAAVPNQASQRKIVLSPVLAGRSYTVTTRTNLITGTWQPLGSFSVSDNNAERTVTDLNAGTGPRFYHIEILKP